MFVPINYISDLETWLNSVNISYMYEDNYNIIKCKIHDIEGTPYVVIFDFEQDGLNDHVGFVVKDNGDGTITTLEGNTSGEAGGSCVAIHTDRQRSIVYGYATPVKK